jgi:hypothetical protein
MNGIMEVAGPEQFRLDEFIRHGLRFRSDPRTVVADAVAGYFGVEVDEIIKKISHQGFAAACQRVRLLGEKQALAEKIRRNKIMLAWARN